MFICGWKFENGNIYCMKRKHEVIVALTHTWYTMFTSVLENVHTLHRRGAFLNWSSSLLHLLRIL